PCFWSLFKATCFCSTAIHIFRGLPPSSLSPPVVLLPPSFLDFLNTQSSWNAKVSTEYISFKNGNRAGSRVSSLRLGSSFYLACDFSQRNLQPSIAKYPTKT